ncbi:hypothetical protein L7F22_038541 [Adiantum nelumboides]|nr:hypothetical protein [Adiantum nelumboides]
MVMHVGKRTTREQDTSDASPSHKRGKQAKTGTGKEKKKRKPRRHYNTSDFPLGEGQPNYNIRADLMGRKADVTFGQLMEMCPRLKRQWKRMVNPMKNEPTKKSVRVLSLNKIPDICPTIDAWHKRKCIGEAYIDGRAQVEVFDVKVLVNFYVMPVGFGAFPLILGRPWLQATKAIQDWGHGTITLYNRSGDKKKFGMAIKQSLDADFDVDDDDEEYSSEEEDDGEESSEVDDSSGDNDVEVSSLFLEEDKGQMQENLFLMENEETSSPYEQIEGLMQPKVQSNFKEEPIQKMLSLDLTSHEKGEYLHMLQQFPNLFIISYEKIRGFKEEAINIPIKEGAQPMHQKLRRMGQVQLNALKEEVDKLLKAGFIYPDFWLETAELVSFMVQDSWLETAELDWLRFSRSGSLVSFRTGLVSLCLLVRLRTGLASLWFLVLGWLAVQFQDWLLVNLWFLVSSVILYWFWLETVFQDRLIFVTDSSVSGYSGWLVSGLVTG